MKSTSAEIIADAATRTEDDGQAPVERAPSGEVFHAALTVAVIGFGHQEAARHRLSEDERQFLSGRLGTACAVAASEFGGKLLARPGWPKVIVFGMPALHEMDAERAVLAAQKVLRTFTRDRFSHPVSLRCGIASGDGIVTLQGGPNMAPLAIEGSAHDTAMHLHEEAPDNELLVSADAFALFRSDFMARKVRVRDGQETAYQVSPAASPSARSDDSEQNARSMTFTGRADELGALAGVWQDARAGAARTAVLQGEPGIGKSCLIREFLATTLPDHPLVLHFHGSVHHKRTPYFPIARGLHAFLGLKGFQSPTLLSTVIEQFLVDLDLNTARDVANLRAILKGSGLDSHPSLPDSAVDSPTDTLVACLRQLSAIHPVVLVYEDAHWMDISTLETILLLQEALAGSKVLILVSKRPGPLAIDLTAAASLNCRVGQLDEGHTRALAGRLRPAGMDERQFDEIVRRSDGIPLFLEELMHNAADLGRADPQVPRTSAIPASLRETLAARLAHLGDSRALLFMAAAIGREFPQALLRDMCGLPTGRVSAQLAALEAASLIQRKWPAEDGIWEFRHSLVQDQAYESIPSRDRIGHHRAIAAALTGKPGRYPPVAFEVIARHFERAGDIPAALEYLEKAGIEAVLVAANRDAGRYFGKALDLAQKLPETAARGQAVSRFLLLLGPQLIANHGFASEQVRDVYTRARTLTSAETPSTEILQMIWGLWGAHIVKVDIALARTLGNDFLRLARAKGSPLELAAGHYMTGVGAFYVGDLAEAEEALLAAVDAALKADFDEMITRYSLDLGIVARSYLAWCYALNGDSGRMRENSLSLETAALLSDHAFCQAFSSCFLATAYNFLGDAEAAAHHAESAADLSRDQGFAQQLAQAQINLGRARLLTGDDNGLELMESGLHAYSGTGAALARPYAEAWIAEALLARRTPEDALTRLINVRRFTLHSGERYFDAELLRLTALAAGAARPGSGRLVGALLARSEAYARRTGNRLHLDRALGSRG